MLWDVDGTLVRAGSAGRDAFGRAVAHVLGREVADAGVSMSGKTDPQIALEILARAGAEGGEGHLAAVLARLEHELAAAEEAIRREGVVLPGVAEVLDRLAADPAVVQSVLTGNLAPNAAVKLGAFSLDSRLDLAVGAYGSDHRDRRELVPVALAKLRRHRGVNLTAARVWVVGDTPLDYECAAAGGARCLLVGTGRFPAGELRPLGADAVLDDLSDAETVAALLRS